MLKECLVTIVICTFVLNSVLPVQAESKSKAVATSTKKDFSIEGKLVVFMPAPFGGGGAFELGEGTTFVNFPKDDEGAGMSVIVSKNDVQYQIFTNKKTKCVNLEHNNDGITWQLGQRYRIKGIISDKVPDEFKNDPISNEAKYIIAREVILLK